MRLRHEGCQTQEYHNGPRNQEKSLKTNPGFRYMLSVDDLPQYKKRHQKYIPEDQRIPKHTEILRQLLSATPRAKVPGATSPQCHMAENPDTGPRGGLAHQHETRNEGRGRVTKGCGTLENGTLENADGWKRTEI